MNSMFARRTAVAAVASVALCAAVAAPTVVRAAAITVVVNGAPLQFDQPPIERAGRVFVPLRGVFERLGASVVYQNGLINATGDGHTVSLHIGSTQALVDGRTQALDVAPFVIGARTLVPLRFVAQALGAYVGWNNADATVTITGAGASGATPAPPANRSFHVVGQRPRGAVGTLQPALHAGFSEPIDQSTLHVAIDGRDVTADVSSNANGFDVTAPFQLQAGEHHVTLTGTTQAGAQFSTGWSFATGGAAGTNYLGSIVPAPGARVGANFNLSGRTIPGSQVKIVASGEASALGGILQIGTGTYQTSTQADGNGVFNANIVLTNVNGSVVRVLIQSIAPNGSSTERSFTYTM